MLKSTVKKRIFAYLAVLLVVIFFVYQIIIWMLNDMITTEAVISYTVFDEISADAVFIRNEQIIEKSSEGVYNYSVLNGEKVKSGGLIASVYSDKDSAENDIKLNKLKQKKEELISLQNTGTNYFADIDLINAKIDSDILKIIDSVYYAKDLSSVSEIYEDLLIQFNKKQISTGHITNFNSIISELDTQISSLESSAVAPLSSVFSPISGYFVNAADGYENQLQFDDLTSLSVAEVNNFNNIKPVDTTNYIGKVIIGDKWNVACVVDSSKASMIKIGQEVLINIPQISLTDISAEVIAINYDDTQKKASLVLECNEISDDLVDLRFESISIHANHYSGLRISRESIRVLNGITGVYVVSKNEAKFKKINIIFSSVDFVICSIEDKNNALMLYDEVITEGTNLYDGKVIK